MTFLSFDQSFGLDTCTRSRARGHEAVKYFRVPIQDGLTAKNNIKETSSFFSYSRTSVLMLIGVRINFTK